MSILSVVVGCRQKGSISKTSKSHLVQKNNSKSSETVVVKVEEDISSEIRFDVSVLVAPLAACSSDFLSYSSSDTSLVASQNAVKWGGVWPNCTAVFSPAANVSGTATVEITAHYAATSITVSKLELAVTAVDDAPVAADITPAAFDEDTASNITLSYSDIESDKGTSCTLSNLSQVTITTPCACDDGGICTVGVTGASNYNGAAGFSYTITANGAASAAATARLSIAAVEDAPMAQNITPAAFREDTTSNITLSYIDADNDKATACTLSALSHVTETTPCACDSDGVCTVGVKGTSEYSGPASFSYTVTANGATSPAQTATLSIIAKTAPTLEFSVGPNNVAKNDVMATIKVVLHDSTNEWPDSGIPITLQLASPPSGGKLGGVRTVNTVNNEAVFTDIRVNIQSDNLYISAKAPRSEAFLSSPFNSTTPSNANLKIVTDWEDLSNINSALSGEYLLANNLGAADVGYSTYAGAAANGGLGWNPIGSSANFTGKFDGNGYAVSDLVMNTTGQNLGLFGVTSGAQLIRVKVRNASVTSTNWVIGGVVGTLGGTLTDSSLTGNVTGGGHVGGLVGIVNAGSTVTGSWVNATVTGNGYTGGLVGTLNGSISSSFSVGVVTPGSAPCCGRWGGLVGEVSSGTLQDSWSGATVYSLNQTWVGGLVGRQYYGTIVRNFAFGSVLGTEATTHGILGTNVNGTRANNYWNTQTSGISKAGMSGTAGLTTAQMKGAAAAANLIGFDFTGVWASMVSGVAVGGYTPAADWYPLVRAVDLGTQATLAAGQ